LGPAGHQWCEDVVLHDLPVKGSCKSVSVKGSGQTDCQEDSVLGDPPTTPTSQSYRQGTTNPQSCPPFDQSLPSSGEGATPRVVALMAPPPDRLQGTQGTAAHPHAADSPGGLRVGDWVLIRGLASASACHLNLRYGSIVSIDSSTGRCGVLIDNIDLPKSIRTNNLFFLGAVRPERNLGVRSGHGYFQ
jgi:hypothetical protein